MTGIAPLRHAGSLSPPRRWHQVGDMSADTCTVFDSPLAG